MALTPKARHAAWIFVTVGGLIVLFLLVMVPVSTIANNKEYGQQLRLERSGQSATAFIDGAIETRGSCNQYGCHPAYRIFYHFSAGERHITSEALISKRPQQSTTEVRYDPANPHDNRVAEQHVSAFDVWSIPAFTLLLGLFLSLPVWNTWRTLRRDILRRRRIGNLAR